MFFGHFRSETFCLYTHRLVWWICGFYSIKYTSNLIAWCDLFSLKYVMFGRAIQWIQMGRETTLTTRQKERRRKDSDYRRERRKTCVSSRKEWEWLEYEGSPKALMYSTVHIWLHGNTLTLRSCHSLRTVHMRVSNLNVKPWRQNTL